MIGSRSYPSFPSPSSQYSRLAHLLSREIKKGGSAKSTKYYLFHQRRSSEGGGRALRGKEPVLRQRRQMEAGASHHLGCKRLRSPNLL